MRKDAAPSWTCLWLHQYHPADHFPSQRRREEQFWETLKVWSVRLFPLTGWGIDHWHLGLFTSCCSAFPRGLLEPHDWQSSTLITRPSRAPMVKLTFKISQFFQICSTWLKQRPVPLAESMAWIQILAIADFYAHPLTLTTDVNVRLANRQTVPYIGNHHHHRNLCARRWQVKEFCTWIDWCLGLLPKCLIDQPVSITMSTPTTSI